MYIDVSRKLILLSMYLHMYASIYHEPQSYTVIIRQEPPSYVILIHPQDPCCPSLEQIAYDRT